MTIMSFIKVKGILCAENYDDIKNLLQVEGSM